MIKQIAAILILSLIGWLPIRASTADDPRDEEAIRKRAAEAAAAVEKLGWKVERDMKAPGQPVVAVSVPTCTCLRKEADLAHLESLTDLRKLELRNDCKSSKLTDKGLSYLTKLTKLESLYVADSGGGAGISDAGLTHLKGLTNLRELVILENRNVSEAGIKELQKALPKTTIKRLE